MNRLTSIIFDLDGTLYRSHDLDHEIGDTAADKVARLLGVDPEEAKIRLRATKTVLTAQTGHETTLSAACKELGCDIRELHEYLAAQVKPERYLARDERVCAMLDRLGTEQRLYLYTNNNRSLTDRIMHLIGVEGKFADTFTVEDFWRPKPDRLALAKIYAAIGAEPVECLFVGDRYDVDLRLPEEHGSTVFLTTAVDQLLTLENYLTKEK